MVGAIVVAAKQAEEIRGFSECVCVYVPDPSHEGVSQRGLSETRWSIITVAARRMKQEAPEHC